jgi:hypothetical protein
MLFDLISLFGEGELYRREDDRAKPAILAPLPQHPLCSNRHAPSSSVSSALNFGSARCTNPPRMGRAGRHDGTTTPGHGAQSGKARPGSKFSIAQGTRDVELCVTGARLEAWLRCWRAQTKRRAIKRTRRRTSSRRSPQLVQQRLRLLQIERFEALGEPAVYWCEEIAAFGTAALVAA